MAQGKGKGFIISFAAVILIITIHLLFFSGNSKSQIEINYEFHIVESHSAEIEAFLSSLEDIPNYIAFPLGNTTYQEDDLKDMLRLIVQNDDEIYGSTCAFEPYKFNADSFYFAPYYYKHNDTVSYKNLGNKEYDYFSWNWYLVPKRLKKPFWTEPYFDEGGGNINLVTYSVPIFKYHDDSHEFMGVITVDMSLAWINKIVGSVKLKKGDFALLVSKLGTVISTDNNHKIWRLNESIFSLAEELNWTDFRAIGKKIIDGKSGFDYFTDKTGERYLITYLPIKKSNWSFLVAVKVDKN